MKKIVTRIIATILVVLASFYIVMNLFMGFETIHDMTRGYEISHYDSTYYWTLSDGDYVRLLNRRLEDKADGYELDEEYAVCAAAADYYYAAVLYKAYTHTGDGEAAAVQKAKMDAARSAMAGDMAYADEIDAFLEDR